MDRVGSSSFALHLQDVRHRTPDVRLALGGPLVRALAHRGRRGDGIDGADLVHAVRDRSRRLVAVDRLYVAIHGCSSPRGSGCMAIAPQGHWLKRISSHAAR